MLDQETKKRIDNARDVLVGKVPDPKAQVEQITTALIYKFMDDMDRETESMGGKARFFTGELEEFAWPGLMSKALSGVERLDLYVRAITKFSKAEQIPQLFRDIFKDAFLPYRDAETLNLFLKEIDGFTYDHSENLGNAFEYLLSILGSQGDAGQFRTPRHIIDFIVEVVDPKKHETILDPACGTAGFLISSYKHIIKQNSANFKLNRVEIDLVDGPTAVEAIVEQSTKYRGEKLSPDDRKKLMANFTGYDISPDMVRLSLVNLYLHGFADPKITEYDTLTFDKHWDESFHVVLANPPFMTPKGGIRPHKRFRIQANRSEVLFVDYIAEHLRPNGRAGIIVPDGIVSNTNASAYINLRKTLVDENYLWAVVSMPSGVFNPYAKAKTTILFLDRDLAKRKDGILFVRLENDGFDLGEQRKKIKGSNIPKIISILKSYKQNNQVADNLAHVIAKKIISKTKSYLLSGDYYLHHTRKNYAKHQCMPLSQIIKETSLKVKDSNIPLSNIEPLSITMKEGLIRQVDKFNKRIASANISGYKLVKKGQLVVGFPIDEGVLDVLQIVDYGAVSPAYSVWDVLNHPNLDLDYFNLVIKSEHALEIYKKLMNRTANRRRSIKKDIFLKIEIPIPPIEKQREAIALLKESKKLRNKADRLELHSHSLINAAWD